MKSPQSCRPAGGARDALRRSLTLAAVLLPLALPAQNVTVTVDAARAIRTVDARLLGLNAVMWDKATATPQTIDLLGRAGIRVIRIPGGSLSDAYHWSRNESTDQKGETRRWDSGMDAFARLITGLGAQAFVTVNYGSGTPEEAAAWVAYANAPAGLLGTKGDVAIGRDGATDWKTAGYWSHLRAEKPRATDDGLNFLRAGRAAPYGFRDWEIGNECYGTWEMDVQPVPHDPYTYAVRTKAYLAAMRAVDPSVKVGVVVVNTEDLNANNTAHPATNPRTKAVHNGWNAVLLATLHELGVTPDFVVYHRYEQTPLKDTDAAHAEDDARLLQKAGTWPKDAAEIRRELADYLGAAAGGVEIDVTENNSVYANPGKQTTSLVDGLYLADSFGHVLQTEINAFVWWDLRNGVDWANNNSATLYGWRGYGDYGVLSSPSERGPQTADEPYPTYYVFKLLALFARPGDAVVAAASTDDLLGAFAVRGADGNLRLLLVNKDPARVLNLRIDLAGFTPHRGEVQSYGIPQDDAARPGGRGSPDVRAVSFHGAAPSFAFPVAPYSVTVLVLEPRRQP